MMTSSQIKKGCEKEKSLNDKIVFVDSWNIGDKEDIHPSHRTAILYFEDVKDFISTLKEEIRDIFVSRNPNSMLQGFINGMVENINGRIDKLTGDLTK